MSGFYYDLHIHSCVSPCADEDMTPNNIVNMAKLKGLDVIALTDHNTCANCRATMRAGSRAGLFVIPGMELCTAEDIHTICLFDNIDGAERFSAEVHSRLPAIANRPDIYGEQTILDEDDNPVGDEPLLLLNAAMIGIYELLGLAARYGGAVFPAHIDRQAYGILGVLGSLPKDLGFAAVELSSACDKEDFFRLHPETAGLRLLRNSDAHSLWQINEPCDMLQLENLSTQSLISYVR